MANQNEVAEQVVREGMVAMVELNQAQADAVSMMGRSEELDAIARATLSARIKGDFKRYREAETKVNSQIYDDSSRRGAKWPMSKDEFLKSASAKSLEIWNSLGE